METTTVPAPTNGNGPAPGSLLAGLKARNTQVREAKTVRIVIAGYKRPWLFGTYRLLDPNESKEIGARLNADFDDDLDKLRAGNTDLLIRCIERFEARTDPEGPFVPLDDAGGDPITRWDALADAVSDIPYKAPDGSPVVRLAVQAVFMGNPNAAFAHAQQLQDWMADTSIGVDREFLGEA